MARKNRVPARDLTLDQWAAVDTNWANGNRALDILLSAYGDHRSQQNCAHPVCSGGEFDEALSELDIKACHLLLRVAVNRLEVTRLEKGQQDGLEPDYSPVVDPLHDESEDEVQWETFRTGTGQKLRVHSRDNCQGEYCVIHRPMPGPWDSERGWLTHWRADRRIMERCCPHGVGHTALDGRADDGRGVHGCDGCCIGRGPVNE